LHDAPHALPLDPFGDLIQPFNRRGVDLGLDRLNAALADLGHPERHFSAVQVAGTNGKGSICTLVHQALLAAGIRAGSYTSPHLVSWTERIRLGEQLIAEKALRQQLERSAAVAHRHHLTPFELVTAAAFLAFAEAALELVVLEVGLGGRLDATSCHPQRDVIGFARIGLDHAEHLGQDVSSIAREKGGVLTPGCIAISGPQTPDVQAVLEKEANLRGAELRLAAPLKLEQWTLGLPGAVQAYNGAVARGMLQALGERGWPVTEEAMRQGFARAHWPGRLQQISWRGIPLLLDGAHNVPAAQALAADLRSDPSSHGLQSGPRHWVLGILANKQGPDMLDALLEPNDRAWIVPVTGHASWSSEQLSAARPERSHQLDTATDLQAALVSAHRCTNSRLIVAGSLYLLGSLLASA
jgi:dihydrofolate synthase/folylpolyglutamate synthase